jgi:cellulose synthase (UDP-forming)
MGLSDFGLTFILIGAATLLLPHLDPRDDRPRMLLFGISILLLWRYIGWRFSMTIPPLAPNLESLYAWMFALVEAAAAVGSTLAFVTLGRTRDRARDVSEARAWLNGLRLAPRVDVLITTFNEEETILARSIVGALSIDFPGVRVWVLDDGRRPWVEQLCYSKKAHYLSRPDNRHAKAGNINHALTVIRREPDPPEFIVLLDADFIPQRNFLWRTMPLFHDEQVGLVQTPQHFFNNDPIQSNLLIGKVWPDEQRFFFDHVMASKDAWGAAFCCGTSSVIRVGALEEIGGFPTDSVTEDFLVTLELDRHGWRTVYLNERLSAGLAPEGIKEYLTQRGRWCLGLMQIIRSSIGPFSRAHLSPAYRVGLIDALIYWAISFPFKLLCLTVPIVYWFTGLNAVQAPLDAIVHYFLPYYLSVMITLGWATGGLIQPILTDVTHVLTMFEAIRATLIGLLKPHGHPFKVTAKGGRRDQLIIAWPMVRRFAVLASLTLFGMLYASVADFAPSHVRFDAKVMNLGWSVYNIIVLLLAISVCVELPRYRREERFATDEPVRICSGDRTFTAPLADISVSGARIQAPRPGPVGSTVMVALQHVGNAEARIVDGSNEMFVVEFVSADKTRDALIRKLFSGRYGQRSGVVDWAGVIGALFARVLR